MTEVFDLLSRLQVTLALAPVTHSHVISIIFFSSRWVDKLDMTKAACLPSRGTKDNISLKVTEELSAETPNSSMCLCVYSNSRAGVEIRTHSGHTCLPHSFNIWISVCMIVRTIFKHGCNIFSVFLIRNTPCGTLVTLALQLEEIL